MAARGEYMSDRGGLFSGITQALKEGTATFDYRVADGFLMRLVPTGFLESTIVLN